MKRLNPKRKVFLSLVKEMEQFFDDEGGFCGSRISLEFLIERVADKAPKSVKRDINWIVGSALWYCSQEKVWKIPVEDCHEMCKGGEAYSAALQVFRELGAREGVQE